MKPSLVMRLLLALAAAAGAVLLVFGCWVVSISGLQLFPLPLLGAVALGLSGIAWRQAYRAASGGEAP